MKIILELKNSNDFQCLTYLNPKLIDKLRVYKCMPTQINSISIDNVRGISAKTFTFSCPEMIGNKFHVLLAPNGFGKSSIAAAFDSLRPSKLKLPDGHLHQGKAELRPRIEIVFESEGLTKTVTADDSQNEISKEFSVRVINSKLIPRAVSRSGFNVHAKPTASMAIEPVVIASSIPKDSKIELSKSELKRVFGQASKLLPPIDKYLKNPQFLTQLLELNEAKSFTQLVIWKKLDPLLSQLASKQGTETELIGALQGNFLPQWQELLKLKAVAELFDIDANLKDYEKYLLGLQFCLLLRGQRKQLQQALRRAVYLSAKSRLKDLLQNTNSNPGWIGISPKEKDGQLIVAFPDATSMSNGQRDLLSFISQLIKAEFEFVHNKSILIIDEVFDYLDECNLLVAQYYLSEMMARMKVSGSHVFILILSHLNPEVFEHSVLGLGKKDSRRVHVLDQVSEKERTSGVAKLVRIRNQEPVKDQLSKFFFHYHPEESTLSQTNNGNALKAEWLNSKDFYAYCFKELQKFQSDKHDVDFVAACIGCRIAIEKAAFDKLSDENKQKFTETFNKGTKKKLDFAEELGAQIPEHYRILGLIYNDMLHPKEHFDYISHIISKMRNAGVKAMIKGIEVPLIIQ
jgi:hypothetical protein